MAVGQNRLWVRSLDSVNAVPLAGTDGANYPFWSPDSTRIGFFAQGQLKTIAAAGGLAVPVCDAANGRGGTWNRDGVILFTPDAVGGLYRVADTGGAAVRVTTVAPGPTDSDRFPEFLPDGRRFLFLRMSSGQRQRDLCRFAVRQSRSCGCLPDASNAQYVPGDGPCMASCCSGAADTLMAQPFDPDRLTITGGASACRTGQHRRQPRGTAPSRRRERHVAYVSGIRGGNRQLVWLDRSGKRLSVVSKPDEINSWALSPDGKHGGASALAMSVTDRPISGCSILTVERRPS